MKDITVFKSCSAVLGGFLGALFGVMDGFLYTLIVFTAIDYITGVLSAVSDKKLSSEIGFKGIVRKITIFLMVAVANIIDVHIIKAGSILRMAVILFYISNEGISILENAAVIGLPVPERIRDILEQIKTNGDDANVNK